MGTLEENIFPSGQPRDGYDLRLEYVGSWESQLVGLGRLTAFLTPRMLEESHAFDDLGLNVVFLQRHRVELGLKLILERAEAKIVPEHNIPKLRDACATACVAAGFDVSWGEFLTAQGEFIDLMDAADPDAAHYRYPVDRKMRPLKRGLVELRALEETGLAFQESTIALIDDLASLEPLPVPENEAAETAAELQALIHWCNESMRGAHHNLNEFRKQTRALGLPPDRSKASYKADLAMDGVGEVTQLLAARSRKMLDRLVVGYDLELGEEPTPAALRSIPPLIPLRPSTDMRESQRDQIRVAADNMIATMRPLALATNASYRRTRDWTTPAAKQLHLDIARFRSRLSLTDVVEDNPDGSPTSTRRESESDDA